MVCSMRRTTCLALLALVVSPTVGSSQTAKSKSSVDRKDRERIEALLEAHNRVREEAKLAPLTLDPRLNAAALVQATDMAKHEMMSHEGTDGSTFNQRIDRQGYRYKAAAENVAAGQKTVGHVMKSWMDSPHHKENILGPYAQVGFGIARDENGVTYWCADFATPWPKTDPKAGTSDVVEALNRARGRGPEAAHSEREADGRGRLGGQDHGHGRLVEIARADGGGPGPQGQGEWLQTSVTRRVDRAGQTTGAEVAKQWLASPAEQKIILGDFSEVGVGVAASEKGVPHWCLILARPCTIEAIFLASHFGGCVPPTIRLKHRWAVPTLQRARHPTRSIPAQDRTRRGAGRHPGVAGEVAASEAGCGGSPLGPTLGELVVRQTDGKPSRRDVDLDDVSRPEQADRTTFRSFRADVADRGPGRPSREPAVGHKRHTCRPGRPP